MTPVLSPVPALSLDEWNFNEVQRAGVGPPAATRGEERAARELRVRRASQAQANLSRAWTRELESGRRRARRARRCEDLAGRPPARADASGPRLPPSLHNPEASRDDTRGAEATRSTDGGTGGSLVDYQNSPLSSSFLGTSPRSNYTVKNR